MNELQVFNFKNNKVRTLTINNEIWFIAKDVAEALGFKDSSRAINYHVDSEDKGVANTPTPGGNQNMITINESGLYSLVLSSRLESAREFKRWVTSEVLPQIRQTGSYSITDSKKEIADLILKCNMVEQVELIRDLYNIPYTSKTPQNNLVEPQNVKDDKNITEHIKALKNTDISNEKDRYQTIDDYFKNK